jgi:hypothetical protein
MLSRIFVVMGRVVMPTVAILNAPTLSVVPNVIIVNVFMLSIMVLKNIIAECKLLTGIMLSAIVQSVAFYLLIC